MHANVCLGKLEFDLWFWFGWRAGLGRDGRNVEWKFE
jgi:hypothetical protein